MTNYLLDTNHASWLKAQQDSLVARLRQAQVDEAAAELWGITDRELRKTRRSLGVGVGPAAQKSLTGWKAVVGQG